MDVFLLWHTHDEDDKLIGVYSSQAAAEAALSKAKTLPGFCDAPNEFEIAPYQLDQDQWTEGYGTVVDD